MKDNKNAKRIQDYLQGEYKATTQYTETFSYQQNVKRTHRNKIPMPEIQQQLPLVKKIYT